MIPHTFHRVWLKQDAEDTIPEEFEYNWNRLKQLHPGWRFVTWSDEADLFRYLTPTLQEVYDAQATHAGRSDLARYVIMHALGGIYLDTDVEPLRSFDPLVTDPRPFAGWENDRMICPTVLGSPPGHPAFAALLDALPAWVARRIGFPPNQQTGPHFLTRMWRDRDDVKLFAPITFYPVGWWERNKLGRVEYPHESFAVHHWSQSWDPGAKAQIDARQSK